MATLSARTVGVMGSGSAEHEDYAGPVGEALAELGVNLLTGGGGGVMTAVSRAFTARRDRRGICIGIIPCASETDRMTPRAGYPNQFIELAIYTHLPYSGRLGMHDLSRNHINVLSCAAIVALPGEEGTATEVSLAQQYGKPVVAYASVSAIRHFPQSVRRVESVAELKQFLRPYLDDGA
ncbi:MAG TPA: hypothetical protein VM818_00910 [Vicinamibacterales bacterium]|nr:hypothetical protein [Vicinamibacterales bacterium]